jgi:hypothetical protein
MTTSWKSKRHVFYENGKICNIHEIRNVYKIVSRKPEREEADLGDVNIYGRIIVKWILKKYCVDCLHLALDRIQS